MLEIALSIFFTYFFLLCYVSLSCREPVYVYCHRLPHRKYQIVMLCVFRQPKQPLLCGTYKIQKKKNIKIIVECILKKAQQMEKQKYWKWNTWVWTTVSDSEHDEAVLCNIAQMSISPSPVLKDKSQKALKI